MWFMLHIAQSLIIVVSFNEQISLSIEAFKIISHGLNRAKDASLYYAMIGFQHQNV